MRVLVVGGRGGFGHVIAQQLHREGHEVTAAGRSTRGMDEQPKGIAQIALDRDRIATTDLSPYDLIVDAAGPFRDQDRSLARTCIAARVDCIDIADDRAFVLGVRELDDEARAADVRVLSGCSSIPTLSGSMAHDLSRGMDAVHLVEIAITASSRAAFGRSVLHSMLSGAGRAIQRSDGTRGVAMAEPRTLRIPRPGRPPMVRTVLEVDTPDHALIAEGLPGRPTVRFHAGGELAVHNLAMRLVARLARRRPLRDPGPLVGLARATRHLTSRMGDGESAMEVRVTGDEGRRRIERVMTIVARRNQGPLLPCMGGPAIVAAIAEGRVPPGARPATGILSHEEIVGRMPVGSIETARVERAATPLYPRVVAGWSSLPEAVRRMHDAPAITFARGKADIERGRNPLARLVAAAFRFPKSGRDVPVSVQFGRVGDGERWTRDFGGRRFSSLLTPTSTGVRERFGPFTFRFRLERRDDRLAMVPRSWRAFGIRLPRRWMPDGIATEREEGGVFHFDVPIRVPGIGLVVHYRGWLENVPRNAA